MEREELITQPKQWRRHGIPIHPDCGDEVDGSPSSGAIAPIVGTMCPMCEKRAQLLVQQQHLQQQQQQQQQQRQRQQAAVLESSLGTSPARIKPLGDPPSNTKASLFRSPFQSCKNFTHQCCSPVSESQRTSLHSVRRSSVRPSLTPDHSGEIAYLQYAYRLLESPFNARSSLKENQRPVVKTPPPNPSPKTGQGAKKPRGLLTRLKLLTQGAASQQQGEVRSVSADSSFTACGRKVLAVVDSPEHVLRAITPSPPLVALESSLSTTSEASLSSTMISMWNLNGSFSSYRGSTLQSSTYDDDASTFAIIPCTSTNSLDWTSDASGLSDRFGELDLGYSSLEESGEGPDIDDTISISSLQCEDLEPIETFLESDFDQDYSIGSDSLEWFTEPKDPASVLQWPRGNISKNHLHLHLPDLETTPPNDFTALAHALTSLPRHNSLAEEDFRQEQFEEVSAPAMEVMRLDGGKQPTGYLCSRCGRKEKKLLHAEAQTTKNVTQKQNPMSAYFSTVIDGEDQAVMAAKVVVLLGKYGNRRGLRVAGSNRRSLRSKGSSIPRSSIDYATY